MFADNGYVEISNEGSGGEAKWIAKDENSNVVVVSGASEQGFTPTIKNRDSVLQAHRRRYFLHMAGRQAGKQAKG